MTRRTINWKVLAISLVAASIVAGGLYGLHKWQLSRLTAALLKLAAARESDENWLEAATLLDRYLRVHPTEVAVRGKLATVYAKGANSPDHKVRAVELHYRALAAGPSKADAATLRGSLAGLLVETGRYVEAEDEARKVIADELDQPEAWRALALSQFAQWENGSLAASKVQDLRLLATANKARYLNPVDTFLAEVTATFYRDHASVVAAELAIASDADRNNRADACLDELVNQNSKDPKAYLARYRYRMKYQGGEASEDIATALELAPEDVDVLLTAAKSAQREAVLAQEAGQPANEVTAKYQQSLELYQNLNTNKSASQFPDAYLGLGDVQLALGDFDQATLIWRNGLKRFTAPTIQITFLARIADSLLRSNRGDEARDTLDAIDTLIATLGSSVRRDERLAIMQSQDLRRATWHMQRNDAALAVPLLQEVVARQASGASGNAMATAAWTLLGRANMQLDEWGEAAVAYDRAAPLDPKSHVVRLYAGIAWLRVDRPELAVQRAEQALAIQPTAEGMILLATAELDRQRKLPPQQRSWELVERTLRSLSQDTVSIAKLTAPWRIAFLGADLAVFRGRQEGEEVGGRNEAVAILEKAESKYSTDEEFWRLVAPAYQRLGEQTGADRAVAQYAVLSSSVADQAVVKSRLAVLRNDLKLAERILEEASSQTTAIEQSKLRRELIGLAISKGDTALAERLLAVEVQLRPGDVQVLRRACELAVQRGDKAAVAQWEQKLAASGSLGAWWSRYFQAQQLVAAAQGPQDSKLRDALDELAKLIVVRPHWPMPYTLRGMIEQRQGRLEEAVNSFEQAIQLGERKFVAYEQLVAILDQLNRTADAERYLSQLEAQMPFSQRLTEIAANYEMRRDRPAQAIGIAREAIGKRPDDAFAHLWLARLLVANKQFTEAEAEFRRTLELAPDDARAWNGLFTFFLRSGNIEQAQQTLTDLRDKAKLSAVDRNVVLAQCYEMLGDWTSAARQYEEANVAEPARANVHIRLASVYLRSDPQKAEQSLRRALEIEPNSATARRMLAALLGTRGDSSQFQEAEALLRQVDSGSTNIAVADRRLNALILAQRGEARQGVRAAQILEEMIAIPSEGTPGDRLVLAQIYESQGRSSPDPAEAKAKRNAALQHLLFVANQPDAAPSHYGALIEFFLRNNQQAEADKWLGKLESMLELRSPDEPDSLAQLIDLQIRQGSGNRCEKWLKRLSACDADNFRPIALQSRWFVSQARTAEIDAIIEPAAKKLIATATSDQERGFRSRLVGDLYLTTQQSVQAERWYQTAIQYDPAQFPAQVRALTMKGRTEEAIRLCHENQERDTTSQPAIVLASVLIETKLRGEGDVTVDAFLRSALERHSKDVKLLYAVATLRAVQSRYDEAIGLYRSLLELQPRNVPALNNLAMLLAETPEKRAEALTLVDRAIDIAGQQPGLLDTKGAILVYQGQSQQALFLLEAAAREITQDARHKFHLAAAYNGVGNVTLARHQLQAAIDQNLENEVLTPTDLRIFTDLKAALIPN